ncbi:hypothetical protein FKM82_019351, partial [Ascaphus truei]
TRFRDRVEFDTVTIHAINSDHQVSTFRLLAFSEKYFKVKAAFGKRRLTRHELRLKDMEAVKENRDTEDASRREEQQIEAMMPDEKQHQWAGSRAESGRVERMRKIIEKAEKAKAIISQRKKEWEEL